MKKQKEAWGIFSFFSSTNVETKNICPIAYNVLQLYAVVCRLCAVGKLRIGAVISWLRLIKNKTQIEALNKKN